MNRIFSNNLMALAPVYIDNIGNCTKVFVEKKDPFVINKKLPTVLNLIFRHYLLDIKELNKLSKQFITAKKLLPIPFDNENIFIPFKFRIPRYRNDGAFGYLNLRYLEKLVYEKNYIDIVFIDKQSINALSKAYSFQKHFNDGNILKYNFKKSSMLNSEDNIYTLKKTDNLNSLIKEVSLIREYLENIF